MRLTWSPLPRSLVESLFLTLEDVDAVREFLHRYSVTLAR